MQSDDDAEIARKWWSHLDTADKARLRRCVTPKEALLVWATLDLIRRLRWSQRLTERAAALAVILAHVRQDTARPIMRTCGRLKFEDETASLSETRFLRLITTEGTPDLMTALVRLTQIMGRECNVAELTDVLRWWTDKTRQRWASDYYAAAVQPEKEMING